MHHLGIIYDYFSIFFFQLISWIEELRGIIASEFLRFFENPLHELEYGRLKFRLVDTKGPPGKNFSFDFLDASSDLYVPVMAAIAMRKKVVSIGHFSLSFCLQSLQIFVFLDQIKSNCMY